MYIVNVCIEVLRAVFIIWDELAEGLILNIVIFCRSVRRMSGVKRSDHCSTLSHTRNTTSCTRMIVQFLWCILLFPYSPHWLLLIFYCKLYCTRYIIFNIIIIIMSTVILVAGHYCYNIMSFMCYHVQQAKKQLQQLT